MGRVQWGYERFRPCSDNISHPHNVYVNRKSGKVSAVPRHREINEVLAQKICRDLEIPKP